MGIKKLSYFSVNSVQTYGCSADRFTRLLFISLTKVKNSSDLDANLKETILSELEKIRNSIASSKSPEREISLNEGTKRILNTDDVNQCYELLRGRNKVDKDIAESVMSIIRKIKTRSPNYIEDRFTDLLYSFKTKVENSSELGILVQRAILAELMKIIDPTESPKSPEPEMPTTPSPLEKEAAAEQDIIRRDSEIKKALEYTFDEYFDKVIKYGTRNQEATISQVLIKLAPSLHKFYEKNGTNEHTYLELLFANNLGFIAEEICTKIYETKGNLPEEYEILHRINRGESPEFDVKAYSSDFINLAYKVSNNSKNMEMVKKLYPLSGVAEKEEALRKSNPEIYSNYIHEPYWSYNLLQLQEYAGKIINKIKPYFINEKVVSEEHVTLYGHKKEIFILLEGENVNVRRVPFGYVLTNLYLKKCLEDKKDTSRAVPRIFILPKGTEIKFQFKMPYQKDSGFMDGDKRLETNDTGNNVLQVFTNDFVVYQEIIPGSGKLRDKRFMDLGHRDFNAIQIIDSSKDHKAYLVDTKEQKNFFAPVFAPDFFEQKGLREEYKYYCDFPYQNYGIINEETYRKWKGKKEVVVFDAKALNFDPRIIYVNVAVDIDK